MPYIVIGGVLYHYGIPGMEWGKRRFQNKDGTLTEAGKRRYAKSLAKAYDPNNRKGFDSQIREDFDEHFPEAIDRVKRLGNKWWAMQEVVDGFYNNRNDPDGEYQWHYKHVDEHTGRVTLETYDEYMTRNGYAPDVQKKISTEYMGACREVVDQMLGKYGSIRAKDLNSAEALRGSLKRIVLEDYIRSSKESHGA